MTNRFKSRIYESFGESQTLGGIYYSGERLTFKEPRINKNARSPEVRIGGVAAPRQALTSDATGERRSRPFSLDKVL